MSKQVQETKQKWLTFEDIAPAWADFIKHYDGPWQDPCISVAFVDSEGKQRDLTFPDCCMVGEAHGDTFEVKGNMYYGCLECNTFSFSVLMPKYWHCVIPQFVRHYNEVHAHA